MKLFQTHRTLRAAIFTGLGFLLFSSHVSAEPQIRLVQGDLKEGAPFKIDGKGFGEKPDARPVLFADFEKNLNPSHRGQKKEWDRIENMEWAKEGPEGAGCAKAANGSGVWTFCVKRDFWTREGSKAYVFRRQRMNFTISDQSQNWKIWRMWPEDGSYPNIYVASHNGRIFVENIGQESGFWGRVNVPTLDWTNEEIMFQASGMNSKDGVFWFRCNGVDMARGSVMTRSTKGSAYMSKNFAVHGVAANMGRWSPPWSQANRIWVDEVYVDTSWSRVMLGDKPLRREGRHWEIQIPVKWTDASIEIEARPGMFKAGQTAYLFVFNADGISNEEGFPVHIGNNHPAVANAAPVN